MAENVREVAHLCQSIRGFEDRDEYDTAEWLDIDRNDMGFEILSDIDIVNPVQVSEGQGDSESEDDLADDVSQAIASAPTHAEAFTVLETVMSWYETQPESNEVQLLFLKQMTDLAARKIIAKLTQLNISTVF